MQVVKQFAPGVVMIIISAIFISQAITMDNASLKDPAEGSFLPAIISLIMLITGIIVIIEQIAIKYKEKKENDISSEFSTNNQSFTAKEYGFTLTFFLWILIYVVLLSYITFFPATFIFLVGSMIYLKGVSWKVNVSVTIGSIIVIYFVFSKLFHIIFP